MTVEAVKTPTQSTKPGTKTEGSNVKQTLSKKIGPVPVWLLVVLLFLVLWFFVFRRRSSSSSVTGDSFITTAPSTADVTGYQDNENLDTGSPNNYAHPDSPVYGDYPTVQPNGSVTGSEPMPTAVPAAIVQPTNPISAALQKANATFRKYTYLSPGAKGGFNAIPENAFVQNVSDVGGPTVPISLSDWAVANRVVLPDAKPVGPHQQKALTETFLNEWEQRNAGVVENVAFA